MSPAQVPGTAPFPKQAKPQRGGGSDAICSERVIAQETVDCSAHMRPGHRALDRSVQAPAVAPDRPVGGNGRGVRRGRGLLSDTRCGICKVWVRLNVGEGVSDDLQGHPWVSRTVAENSPRSDAGDLNRSLVAAVEGHRMRCSTSRARRSRPIRACTHRSAEYHSSDVPQSFHIKSSFVCPGASASCDIHRSGRVPPVFSTKRERKARRGGATGHEPSRGDGQG